MNLTPFLHFFQGSFPADDAAPVRVVIPIPIPIEFAAVGRIRRDGIDAQEPSDPRIVIALFAISPPSTVHP
jgi:hypothetical protein